MKYLEFGLIILQIALGITCLAGIFLLDGFVLSSVAGGAACGWGVAASIGFEQWERKYSYL